MGFVNMAAGDRISRILFGAVLLAVGWSGLVDGDWGTFFKLFGVLPLATGLSGWCVMYWLLGYRTTGVMERSVTRA